MTEARANPEQPRFQLTERPSEDWLSIVAQQSLDAQFLLDPVLDETETVADFVVVDVNSRVEKLLKLPREKLVGRGLSELVPTYHRELIPRYRLTLEGGESAEEEFSLTTPSGRAIWVRHRVVPIKNGVAVLWRDITREKEVSLRLSANERQYRELLESLHEGIWAADTEGRTAFVSRRMAQMLGYTPEEMLGKPILSFVHERLIESFNAHFRQRARGVRERYEFEFLHKDGSPILFDLEAGPRYDEAGKFIGTIVGLMDVTARRQNEEELRKSIAKLAKAEELAQIGAWSYDEATGMMMSSAELQRLLGMPPVATTISLTTALEVFHPADRALVTRALSASAREGERRHDELRIRRPDGEERVLLFQSEPVRNETGHVVRVDGFAQDLTERKRSEARLEYLATHDSLTDLPNRRLLEDRLTQTIVHLERRPGDYLAVLFLDLEGFKFVNDSLGHAFGDELLKRVARVLQASVRRGDTVARQGADEFIVLLRDLRRAEDVTVAAQKIQKAFERALSIQERELYVAFSIGASLYPADGKDAATLLKNADAAMYRAKQAGGGVQFYTRALSEHASERVRLEVDLRRALEQGEFELYYQPLVAFASRRIVGAEALIRWNRPGAGLVLPGRFIPMAEESGLIGPIGEWVLVAACEQVARWRGTTLPPVRVSVNVSASQFQNGGIEERVAAMARRDDFAPASLELEITERVVMSDAEDAIQRLARLRALGVHLSIDDFGTGYSSLAYLRRLPVDKIKIDRTFVQDLPSSEDAKTLVLAVIELSHAFGFTVLAEGVETRQQAQFLARNGCEELQGYYVAKPMPSAQFEQFLREGRLPLSAIETRSARRKPRTRRAQRRVLRA